MDEIGRRHEDIFQHLLLLIRLNGLLRGWSWALQQVGNIGGRVIDVVFVVHVGQMQKTQGPSRRVFESHDWSCIYVHEPTFYTVDSSVASPWCRQPTRRHPNLRQLREGIQFPFELEQERRVRIRASNRWRPLVNRRIRGCTDIKFGKLVIGNLHCISRVSIPRRNPLTSLCRCM